MILHIRLSDRTQSTLQSRFETNLPTDEMGSTTLLGYARLQSMVKGMKGNTGQVCLSQSNPMTQKTKNPSYYSSTWRQSDHLIPKGLDP